jgi:hypothetical protein
MAPIFQSALNAPDNPRQAQLQARQQAAEQAMNTHGSGKPDPIQENGDSHEG